MLHKQTKEFSKHQQLDVIINKCTAHRICKIWATEEPDQIMISTEMVKMVRPKSMSYISFWGIIPCQKAEILHEVWINDLNALNCCTCESLESWTQFGVKICSGIGWIWIGAGQICFGTDSVLNWVWFSMGWRLVPFWIWFSVDVIAFALVSAWFCFTLGPALALSLCGTSRSEET